MVSLERLQRTMAILESQIDRQAHLERSNPPNDGHKARSTANYIRSMGLPMDADSVEEPSVTQHAFRARVVPDAEV